MKNLMMLLAALVCCLELAIAGEPKSSKTETVVLSATIHCEGCKDKIMKNLPFEAGVKDIVVDIDKKTVTITYRKDKTDVETLRAALKKLGYDTFVQGQIEEQK